MELTDKAKELRNAYQRDWRRRNPEKMRLYDTTYWEKKAKGYSVIQEARDLYLNGMTQREIAERLNIAVGTVNKYLNKG